MGTYGGYGEVVDQHRAAAPPPGVESVVDRRRGHGVGAGDGVPLSRPASSSIVGRRRIHHWSRGLRRGQSASSSARRIGRMRTPPSCRPITAHPVPPDPICSLSHSTHRAANRAARMRSYGVGLPPAGSVRARSVARRTPQTLLLEEAAQEVAGVHGVAPLVADRQEEPLARGEAVDHPCDVVGQLRERHALLVQVHADRAARDPAHQREVAAVPAHGLDHEAAPCGGTGVPDAVHGLDDVVERGVGHPPSSRCPGCCCRPWPAAR